MAMSMCVCVCVLVLRSLEGLWFLMRVVVLASCCACALFDESRPLFTAFLGLEREVLLSGKTLESQIIRKKHCRATIIKIFGKVNIADELKEWIFKTFFVFCFLFQKIITNPNNYKNN